MIQFENRFLKIVLENKGAKVISVIDKLSGREILDPEKDRDFCWIFDRDGRKTLPLEAKESAQGFTAVFEDGSRIGLAVTCEEEYIVFEVMTDAVPVSCHGFAFAAMNFVYDAPDTQSFGVIGYAMTSRTEPCFYPNPRTKAVRANCYREIGARGAKYALVGAPIGEMIEILKKISSTFDRKQIAYSEAGGPWSRDDERNYGDYMIDFTAYPEEIGEKIAFCKKCGIDQIDFHQGEGTFRQGDFSFRTVKDAAEFKEKVSGPLKEAGIVSGLHSYSFYIDFQEDDLLKDPVYQKQLEVLETFTLAVDIDAADTQIQTLESTAESPSFYGFMQRPTPYIIIDEEIIRMELSDHGFTGCVRGLNGTEARPHSRGAKIRRLGSYYNGFVPLPGSDLFYEVARRTARAYNEGGFGMIYFDALDGIRIHSEYDWYYAAEFVREVLLHCENYPAVEYSFMRPAFWIARGRIGAWDYPTRAYKKSARMHIESNNAFRDSFNITTLGWYYFYPDDETMPGNYLYKYQHTDDIDYIGKLSLIYDNTMVYFGPSEELFEKYPAFLKNLEHFRIYGQLRKSHYFSEEYKEKMRRLGGEHKIVSLPDGRFAFKEVKYDKCLLNDCSLDVGTTENPYGEQVPFLRVTGMGSSSGEDPVRLAAFDRKKPLQEQNRFIVLKETMDISKHLALKVKIRGTGTEDAVCIKLKGKSRGESGMAEYSVKLNFEGEREFILAEPNNLEFEELVFEEGKERGFFADNRSKLDMEAITEVNVYVTKGCPEVYMSDVFAVKRCDNPISRPTVIVDGQKLTFECVLDSSGYLEYRNGAAFMYDRYGKEIMVQTSGSSLCLAKGVHDVRLEGKACEGLPMRAAVTFGYEGSVIE